MRRIGQNWWMPWLRLLMPGTDGNAFWRIAVRPGVPSQPLCQMQRDKDPYIVAEVPARELRAEVRKRGVRTLPDSEKGRILVRYLEQRISGT